MNLRHFAASLVFLLPGLLRAQLSVHTDFEGASAKLISVDNATSLIRIRPGGDIARGWPCWWCVRIEGAEPGQVVTIEVLGSEELQKQPGSAQGKPLSPAWAWPERPAISTDGKSWRHGETGTVSAEAMRYRIKVESPHLWAGWGPLFTPATASTMIEQAAAGHPEVKRFELATTHEGHAVQALRIAKGEGKPVIWLQARQHAWESGASWVGAGLLEWLLSGDPLANKLCNNAEIVLVPIMDVDHVLTGDGGKDALPQDHNRDWSDSPHWPEVAAAQARLLDYAKQKRLRVFCDLHNPAPSNRKAFFFVSPKDMLSAAAWESQHRFIGLAGREFAGNPIPLEIVPRESGPSYHPLWRQISKNWIHSHCGDSIIALTLETAWNTPGSTTEGYKKTGACLGRAIAHYLAE